MKKAIVLTGITGHTGLLEPFVDYYRNLGVSEIIAALFMHDIDDKYIIKRLIALNISVCKIYEQPYNVMQVIKDRESYLPSLKDTWVLYPDLDEFMVFPSNNMMGYLHECDKNGIRWIKASLIDRITRDGTLPILDPNNLFQQFPVSCHITRDVLKATDTFAIASCGHNIIDRYVFYRKYCNITQSGSVIVNHFKWHQGVVDRLKKRVSHYQAIGNYWWDESQRFIEHINQNGKINICSASPTNAVDNCEPANSPIASTQ